MAARTEKVTAAAATARPYVQRAITDEELRDSVKSAFQAVREVYGDLMGDRGMARVASKVANDQDIHDNLKTAIFELRNAADRLQGREEHHRKRGFLVVVGVALIALFNPITGPATRGWLKSLVGGGDGKDYAYSGGNGAG